MTKKILLISLFTVLGSSCKQPAQTNMIEFVPADFSQHDLILEDPVERWDEAEDALQKTLDLNPNSAVSWYNLALCYLYFDDYSEAVQAAETAFSLDPSLKELGEDWLEIVDDEDIIEEDYPTLPGIVAS